jgi:hypothetical protein
MYFVSICKIRMKSVEIVLRNKKRKKKKEKGEGWRG